MNDLEMYREQLALCDDKIIDALVERYAVIEKIMAYKEEYGMPILRPMQEEKQERRLEAGFMGINIRKRYMMCSSALCATASGSRPGNSFQGT